MTDRELQKRRKAVNARMQTQGLRAYLRDVLPDARMTVEAELTPWTG